MLGVLVFPWSTKLTWTAGSLTWAQMSMYAVAHRDAWTPLESALKEDSGKKIPCRTRELNLPQRHACLTLYQLSYITHPIRNNGQVKEKCMQWLPGSNRNTISDHIKQKHTQFWKACKWGQAPLVSPCCHRRWSLFHAAPCGSNAHSTSAGGCDVDLSHHE